jgi:hypothetical protein
MSENPKQSKQCGHDNNKQYERKPRVQKVLRNQPGPEEADFYVFSLAALVLCHRDTTCAEGSTKLLDHDIPARILLVTVALAKVTNALSARGGVPCA